MARPPEVPASRNQPPVQVVSPLYAQNSSRAGQLAGSDLPQMPRQVGSAARIRAVFGQSAIFADPGGRADFALFLQKGLEIPKTVAKLPA
jgi:hypothetical protein